jgi:NAD(P)-dependent dehydrogenase (short-subunit alcohol dehydrogenase family)
VASRRLESPERIQVVGRSHEFRTSFSTPEAQIISVADTEVNDQVAATDRALRSEPKPSDQEKIMKKLSNKVALVTGGTSGIGLEAAKLFRDEGATVVVVGQDERRLESAAIELGKRVTVLRGDLSHPADIDAIVEHVHRTFGRLDVLFANAGMGLAAPLEAVTEDQIDKQFDLNFKGVFFTVQKAVPLIAKGGSIIVTTSFLNEVGVPGLSILSASKAAVRSLARSLGSELAARGIRVNAVSPGPISTPFHAKLGLTQKQVSETAAAIEGQVPLHRFGEAIEIAKAALFLASDDSAYMTGSELVVDGGMTQL